MGNGAEHNANEAEQGVHDLIGTVPGKACVGGLAIAARISNKQQGSMCTPGCGGRSCLPAALTRSCQHESRQHNAIHLWNCKAQQQQRCRR